MSTDMINYSLSDMQKMAEAIARSGLFGMKTPDQALALMLVAQSENQHPASITQAYDIIQGQACRKTHNVLARFQQMGGKIEWHSLTDTLADATFSHTAGGILRLQWTMAMAEKAKLIGKDNWTKYSRAMLRARLIAEGVRAVYPAAIGGMNIPEEVYDFQEPCEIDITPEKEEIPVKTLPDYPQETFNSNLPKWDLSIRAKKLTHEKLIAMISTKAVLSPDQTQRILELGREPGSDDGDQSCK
jgi:hypothetical protein